MCQWTIRERKSVFVMWTASNWYSFLVETIYNTWFESLLFPLTAQQQHKRFLGKFKPRNQNIVECLEHFNSNQNSFLSSPGNQFFILGFFLFPSQPKQRENKSVKKITNLTPEKKKYFFFFEKKEKLRTRRYISRFGFEISLNEILRKETQEKPVFSLKPLYSSVFPLMPHLSFHMLKHC